MTALVRAVIRRSVSSGSMTMVHGSTSAKTGVPPAFATELATGWQQKAGTITSSPGPMPSAATDRLSPPVPLEQATTSPAPVSSRSARSSSAVRVPRMNFWSGPTATSCRIFSSASRSASKRSGGKKGSGRASAVDLVRRRSQRMASQTTSTSRIGEVGVERQRDGCSARRLGVPGTGRAGSPGRRSTAAGAAATGSRSRCRCRGRSGARPARPGAPPRPRRRTRPGWSRPPAAPPSAPRTTPGTSRSRSLYAAASSARRAMSRSSRSSLASSTAACRSSILLLVPETPDRLEMPAMWSMVLPSRPWWRSTAGPLGHLRVVGEHGIPASPSAPSVLVGKKDSTPPAPSRPACRPSQRIPIASALSSTTVRPCSPGQLAERRHVGHRWNRCTGITPGSAGDGRLQRRRVHRVVSGSMSAKPRRPPASATAEAVAKKLNAGTTTPSPGRSPQARQQQHQRVGAAVDADHMPGPGVVGERRLELPDLFSVGELAAVENVIQRLFDGRPQSFESRGLREEGNSIGRSRRSR